MAWLKKAQQLWLQSRPEPTDTSPGPAFPLPAIPALDIQEPMDTTPAPVRPPPTAAAPGIIPSSIPPPPISSSSAPPAPLLKIPLHKLRLFPPRSFPIPSVHPSTPPACAFPLPIVPASIPRSPKQPASSTVHPSGKPHLPSPAPQALAQGNSFFSSMANSDSQPSSTTQMSFLRRMLHGAKDLVWKDVSKSAATSSPTLPSPTAASMTAHVLSVKAARLREVAKVNFSLEVLDEDLSVPVEPGEYVEGSAIRIEARVWASPGLFPKLFIDECYGTDIAHRSHARRVYVMVDNHGCLYAGDSDATWFRKEDAVIVLTLPAFLLSGESGEVYIHCFLTAWSQKIPTSPGKKACHFDSSSSRWKNVDEPSKASVCHCCDSSCPSESPLHGSLKAFFGEGQLHSAVVGPLTVRKEVLPWFEGRCHTMKKLLLVSISFVGSCVLAALFVGTLIALILAFLRYSRTGKGHRLLKNQKEQPYHTELQTVVGARAVAEDVEKETSLDYCKLKSDTPEKS